MRPRHPLVRQDDPIVLVAPDRHYAPHREHRRPAAATALGPFTRIPGYANAVFHCTTTHVAARYAKRLVDQLTEAIRCPRIAGVQRVQLVEPLPELANRATTVRYEYLAPILLGQLPQHLVV